MSSTHFLQRSPSPGPVPAHGEPPSLTRRAGYQRLIDRAPATFRLFETIGDAWELTGHERRALLGVSSRATYSRWRADPDRVRMTMQCAERIAQVVTIAEHLLAVHAGATSAAHGWVRRPNTGSCYGGETPLAVMTSGPTEALIRVREDLAGWDRR